MEKLPVQLEISDCRNQSEEVENLEIELVLKLLVYLRSSKTKFKREFEKCTPNEQKKFLVEFGAVNKTDLFETIDLI